MPVVRVDPVVERRVQGLCALPYPKRPRGCPNFRFKPGCPAGTPLLGEVVDLARPVLAVYLRFDLAAFAARQRRAHPGWTEGQCRNILYWQQCARKQLLALVAEELRGRPDLVATLCPEALGVDVVATMRTVGVVLTWDPARRYTYLVALVGVARGAPPLAYWHIVTEAKPRPARVASAQRNPAFTHRS